MFSLLIAVISIVLVGLLTAAAIYYIGDTSRRVDEALADQALTQIQQIHGALELHNQDLKAYPSSLAVLQTTNHLATLPVMSPQFYASGASQNQWELVQANGRAFWSRNTTRTGVCHAINRIANGDGDIHEKADPAKLIQCYGAAQPFTVLFGYDEETARRELPPTEVTTNDPTETVICDPIKESCSTATPDGTNPTPPEPVPPAGTPPTGALRFGSSANYGSLLFDRFASVSPSSTTFTPQGSLLGSEQADADAATIAYVESLLGAFGLSRDYTGPSDPQLESDLLTNFGLTYEQTKQVLLDAGLVSSGTVNYYEAGVSSTDATNQVASFAYVQIGYLNDSDTPVQLGQASLFSAGAPITSFATGGEITTDTCSNRTLQPDAFCQVTAAVAPGQNASGSSTYEIRISDSVGTVYTSTLTGSIGGAQFVFADASGNLYSNESYPVGHGSLGALLNRSNFPSLPSVDAGAVSSGVVYLKNIGTVADEAPSVSGNSSTAGFVFATLDSASCSLVAPGGLCRVDLQAQNGSYAPADSSINYSRLQTAAPGPRTTNEALTGLLVGESNGAALLTVLHPLRRFQSGRLELFSQGADFPVPTSIPDNPTGQCQRQGNEVHYRIGTTHTFTFLNVGNRAASLRLTSSTPGYSSSDPRFYVNLSVPNSHLVPPGGSSSLVASQNGNVDAEALTASVSIAGYQVDSISLSGQATYTGQRFGLAMTVGPTYPQSFRSVTSFDRVEYEECENFGGIKTNFYANTETFVRWDVSGNTSFESAGFASNTGTATTASGTTATLYNNPAQGRMELLFNVAVNRQNVAPTGSSAAPIPVAHSVSGLPAGSTLLYNQCTSAVTGGCRLIYALPAAPNGGSFNATLQTNGIFASNSSPVSKSFAFNFASPNNANGLTAIQTLN